MKDYKKLIVRLALLIILLIGILVVPPYLFLGPPETTLFSINNEDLTQHKVSVEIIDPHNESIFNKTYELAPNERITKRKSLLLLGRTSLPWSDYECKIKVTLDNGITEEHETRLQPWNEVSIWISDGEITIDEMVV